MDRSNALALLCDAYFGHGCAVHVFDATCSIADREAEVQYLASARTSLPSATSGDEGDQRDQPSSGIYGDGPSALLSTHRLDTFPADLVRGTSSGIGSESVASSDGIGVGRPGSTSSSVPVEDDVLSRHRGQSELV